MMTGTRKDKVPGCSETPAPVEVVELAELLKVPVAMVVVLALEVAFSDAAAAVTFEEAN